MQTTLYMNYARDADPASKYGHLSSYTYFEDEGMNDQVHNLIAGMADEVDASLDIYAGYEYDLADNLQAAFRTSFKLSTGSPLVQALLMVRVAQFMNLYTGDPKVLADIAANLQLDRERFVIPARHSTPRRPHRLAKRAQATWEFFMDVCQHPNDPDLLQPRDSIKGNALESLQVLGTFNFVPFAITRMLLDRELVYMDTGRPNRPDTTSRFRSLIRECSYFGKPTGSPEFDMIMQEVKAAIGAISIAGDAGVPKFWLFDSIQPSFESLKQKLEAQNQQPFLPEA